jgi:hypothetical protein
MRVCKTIFVLLISDAYMYTLITQDEVLKINTYTIETDCFL